VIERVRRWAGRRRAGPGRAARCGPMTRAEAPAENLAETWAARTWPASSTARPRPRPRRIALVIGRRHHLLLRRAAGRGPTVGGHARARRGRSEGPGGRSSTGAGVRSAAATPPGGTRTSARPRPRMEPAADRPRAGPAGRGLGQRARRRRRVYGRAEHLAARARPRRHDPRPARPVDGRRRREVRRRGWRRGGRSRTGGRRGRRLPWSCHQRDDGAAQGGAALPPRTPALERIRAYRPAVRRGPTWST